MTCSDGYHPRVVVCRCYLDKLKQPPTWQGLSQENTKLALQLTIAFLALSKIAQQKNIPPQIEEQIARDAIIEIEKIK